MIKHILTAAGLGLLLAGFAVATAPAQSQPVADTVPAEMPVEISGLVDYLATGYGQPELELSLEDAVILALTHNHDLNSARLNAAAACAGIDVAWADLLPQVGIQARGYYTANNYHYNPIELATTDGGSVTFGASGGSGNDLHRSLSIGVTQRIWDFGLSHDLIDVEKAKHGIEVQTVNMLEQALVTNVVKAYYRFNLALGQVRIRGNELALANELLRQSEIQYRTGVVPQLDVIRAQSRVEEAKASLIDAQSTAGDAAAYFQSLLGVEDRRYIPARLSVELTAPGPGPRELDSAIAVALETRPELLLQQGVAETGELGKRLSRNRPVIDAYANTSYGIPAGQAGTDYYEYGIQLSWNLYTGGRDKAAGKQAGLELSAINEDICHLESQVELDVTTAWNAVVAARNSTASAAKTLELAQEAYRAASLGYLAGVTPYTDYLNAMDAEVAAAIGYLVALSEVKLAQAEFARALGYPDGYPGDSRATGDAAATVLAALGLEPTGDSENEPAVESAE